MKIRIIAKKGYYYAMNDFVGIPLIYSVQTGKIAYNGNTVGVVAKNKHSEFRKFAESFFNEIGIVNENK